MRRCALAAAALLAGLCAATVDAAPEQAAEWLQSTIDATCGLRGLTLKAPVEVRAMSEHQGGYTPGVGSVDWPEDHRSTWRDGWCALGVYCSAAGSAAAGGSSGGARRTQLPVGLYDAGQEALFVDMSGPSRGTLAHEVTHALQFQNFPELHAVHPWDNRDFAAAVQAVLEGDAHGIDGFHEGRDEPLALCAMAPSESVRGPRWWDWTPEAQRAQEVFAHAFGLELVLEARAAVGNAGVDALLRSPPLSTLAVLDPNADGSVELIDLASAEVPAPCRPGLANTAGVVGIWGLLALHGEADGTELPQFLRQWHGDRFLHVACPGEDDDGLIWTSRWRNAEAANEFARRYRSIAEAARAHGGLLRAAPEAHVSGSTVTVATPGLRSAVNEAEAAPTRTVNSYREWIEGGCFPATECDVHRSEAPAEGARRFACPEASASSAAFGKWLRQVRRARSAPASMAEADAALAEAGATAAFCAVNASGNSDLLQACRAVVMGVRYLANLQGSRNWQRLPYCTEGRELRDWLAAAYFPDARPPFTAEDVLPTVYGTGLAARTLVGEGQDGLRALASAPPLSTLHLLDPAFDGAVEFLRFPEAELELRGCELGAFDVRGPAGIASLWAEYEPAEASSEELPTFLYAWRGGRQVYLRCEEGEGWVWASRWRDSAAAAEFASSYAMLVPAAGVEASPPHVAVDGRTAWIVPDALATLREPLAVSTQVRAFASFKAWQESGCFPLPACHGPARGEPQP